ncbi:MAG: pirin family protein [Oligoflexia bacterium]|nr:pirin family protein [Oligoflexia bacterium]
MKKLKAILNNQQSHWVGDGFPVKTIFSYHNHPQELSPFLLMDYAQLTKFSPSKHRRGVGEHPHRGFETVTIVYEGEVEHKDSAGGGGLVRKDEVQWMTAASGLVHEEKHGKDFSEKGGFFEMIQLWVNLPQKDKMNKPRYQAITKDKISEHEIHNGLVRLIAGEFSGARSSTLTHTPINLWDIRLKAESKNTFQVPEGHSAMLFVLNGSIHLQDGSIISGSELAVFDPKGNSFSIEAKEDSKALFMGGEIIHEPIVGYGPFVMNSQAEIYQAFLDYESGKMGQLVNNKA